MSKDANLFAVWLPFADVEPLLSSTLAARNQGLIGWCEEQGICTRSVYRGRARGRIKWLLADQLACALGVHPCELWSTWTTSESRLDYEERFEAA